MSSAQTPIKTWNQTKTEKLLQKLTDECEEAVNRSYPIWVSTRKPDDGAEAKKRVFYVVGLACICPGLYDIVAENKHEIEQVCKWAGISLRKIRKNAEHVKTKQLIYDKASHCVTEDDISLLAYLVCLYVDQRSPYEKCIEVAIRNFILESETISSVYACIGTALGLCYYHGLGSIKKLLMKNLHLTELNNENIHEIKEYVSVLRE